MSAELVTQIGKMSHTKLGCNASAAKTADGPVRLAVIFGQANGLKTGEDKRNGRLWTALKGRFEGVNLQNGARFSSGLLFLPDGIQDAIESAVSQINAEGATEGLAVKFAIELRSMKDGCPAGYTFQAINLMPIETGDELSPLRQAIHDTMKSRNLLDTPAGDVIKKEFLQLTAPAAPGTPAPAVPVVDAKAEPAATSKKK